MVLVGSPVAPVRRWWRCFQSRCCSGCILPSVLWPCCIGCPHLRAWAPPAAPHGLLFFEALIGNFSSPAWWRASASRAVAAGVVMAAIPAAVALLSWLVLKEHRPTHMDGCGVGGAGYRLGALKTRLPTLATGPRGQHPIPHLAGAAALVGAALAQAIYSVLGKNSPAALGPSASRPW